MPPFVQPQGERPDIMPLTDQSHTFNLFPELPTELRLQIWAHALTSEWSITAIGGKAPPDKYNLIGVNASRVPPAGHTCREAREVMERVRIRVDIEPSRISWDDRPAHLLGWINPERHLWHFEFGADHDLFIKNFKAVAASDVLRCVMHIVLIPRAPQDVTRSIRMLKARWARLPAGALRTITLIVAQENLERSLLHVRPHACGRGSAYLYDREAPWTKTREFRDLVVAEVDWTPLVNDLEAGGDPINQPWQGVEEAVENIVANFHGGRPRLYWRTPEEMGWRVEERCGGWSG